jgi:hypothetical protein
MSNKLRYGPRFGITVASAKYEYNEHLDRDMKDIQLRFKAAYDSAPLYKQELWLHKQAMATKRTAAKKRPKVDERKASELRMAEALRKVVEILEFHMTDMMQHRPLPGTPTIVNQMQIHNTIVHLRNKCGVFFERDGQYDDTVSINQFRRRDTEDHDMRELLMAKQHQAREAHMRSVAERLIARPKRGPPNG